MLKVRLRRMGARNRPYYRIVVSDSRLTAKAKVLEELGSYDPVAGAGSFSVNRERANYWIGRGASVYEISVPEADRGRLIGREGRTVRALRAFVGAAASARGKKVTIRIRD